jgi:CubicO group peptidase (beta-lactamase class C family)
MDSLTTSSTSTWTPSQDALAEVERVLGAMTVERKALGVAYGVTRHGELIHSGGIGRIGEGGSGATPVRAPDRRDAFRIASLTKSFTAATVLHLAERGLIDRRAPVNAYLPELRLGPHSPDSAAVTVENLLTMSSGMPFDDPWADRAEETTTQEFAALMAAGWRTTAAPGLGFQYSSTGYAIVGAVIEAVTGRGDREVVREVLLEPLGLSATVFDYRQAPRRVPGFTLREGAWVEDPFSLPGALSPMGGLFSTVEDLARWIGWLGSAFPPGAADDADAIVSRAGRRAMQAGQQIIAPVLREGSTRGRGTVADFPAIASYGYGLFIDHDPIYGDIPQHSGGYAGFSTHMRWHLDSGIGLITLANGRHGGIAVTARNALRVLLGEAEAVGRTVQPWPEVRAAQTRIVAALRAGTDPFKALTLAANFPIDVPLDRRRDKLTRLIDQLGGMAPEGAVIDIGAEAQNHLIWTVPARRGALRVELRLTAHSAPQVGALTFASAKRLASTDVRETGAAVRVV